MKFEAALGTWLQDYCSGFLLTASHDTEVKGLPQPLKTMSFMPLLNLSHPLAHFYLQC